MYVYSVQNGVDVLLIDPNGNQKKINALNYYNCNTVKDKAVYDFNMVTSLSLCVN